MLQVNPIVNKIWYYYRDKHGRYVSPKGRRNFGVDLVVNRKKAGGLPYEERTAPQAKEFKSDLSVMKERKALNAQSIASFFSGQGFELAKGYKKRLPKRVHEPKYEKKLISEEVEERGITSKAPPLETVTDKEGKALEGTVFLGWIDPDSEGKPLNYLLLDGVKDVNGDTIFVSREVKKVNDVYGADNISWRITVKQHQWEGEQFDEAKDITTQGHFSMNIKNAKYYHTGKPIKMHDYIYYVIKDLLGTQGFRLSDEIYLAQNSYAKKMQKLDQMWLRIDWHVRQETEVKADRYDFQYKQKEKGFVRDQLRRLNKKDRENAKRRKKLEEELEEE